MMGQPRSIAFAIVAGAVIAASSAEAAAPKTRSRPLPAQSQGSPSEGTLVGGARLEGSAVLRVVSPHRWGMPELVEMLKRSAKRVADKHPGAVLTVADLSRKGGGEIDGHRSHESGRDADVGLYLLQRGRPFLPPRFATIAADGRAQRFPSATFDDARNWALIEAWLTDPDARPLQIFVAAHLRARLLEHARKIGAPANLQARAAEVMLQPRRGLPHDNHFHVRIACPRGQSDCVNFSSRPRSAARAQNAPHRRGS
jgi:penicillin-insensitive murein endopeptidase